MKKFLLIVSFCLVLCIGTGFGQSVTSSAIRGMVEGKTADKVVPLPGAAVEAVHEPTGTVYNSITQDEGTYFIAGMKPGGPYKLTVSMEGFKKEEVSGIMLKLGEERKLNVQLVMEAINAGEVVVIESNPIINPNKTGAAQNVALEAIENMPSINRSLDDLTRVAPQFDSNREAMGSFSVAGRNNRYNNIQIDGTQYNDVFGLGASGTPGGQTYTTPISMDAIQEFQMVLAPFDVRMGSFTGGGVNVITRSGTNDFHGSGYYYGRNQDLVGKGLNDQKIAQFKDKQYGFRLGGPIAKDKLFFFVSGELGRKVTPTDWLVDDSGSSADWGGSIITKADMDRFVSIMKKYGENPGGYDYQYPRNTKSDKVLFRFDYNINNSNRLSIRYNYNNGTYDNLWPTSTSFRMPDYVYFFKSKTQSTVGQLNTTFSPTLFNELTVAYNRIRDRRGPNCYFPEVTVTIRSGYQVKAGAEYSSQANELDQDAVEITDNLTWVKGNHSIVIGTHNEYFKFRNLFIQNLWGGYAFSSLDNFDLGKPSNYYVGFATGADPLWSAKFSVWQLGFYAGDTWSIKPNFKLTYGIRFDVPRFGNSPNANPYTVAYFGIPTDQTPTGNWLVCPRAGFNWDVNSDGKNQIRGGVGKFAGRTPYVWISNNFSNNGIETASYAITGAAVPNFEPDPAKQPRTFSTGAGATMLNLVNKNFKFPQVLRSNLAYDRQLPWGMVGTVEWVVTNVISDVVYNNLNLAKSGKYWADGRPWYGNPTSAGNRNWNTSFVYPKFSHTLYLDNTDRGYTTEVSGQLQKQFSKGLSFNGSYTWGKSKDVMSATSSVAYSNWRYTGYAYDPNNLPMAYSNFDVKHRIVFSASYTHSFIKKAPTTISAIYTGRSGKPYSSIYANDFNGDGTAEDLLYVPRTMDDNMILVSTSGAALTDAQRTDMWNQLNSYIMGDPALAAARGTIINRNANREPWNHTLDLRLLQSIPMPWLKGHKVEFSMDVLNFLNVLNKNWGVYRYMDNDDGVLYYWGQDTATGKPKMSFGKSTRFTVNEMLSRWQIQFGVRYVF